MDVMAIPSNLPRPVQYPLAAGGGAAYQNLAANLAADPAFNISLGFPNGYPVSDTTLLQSEYPLPVLDTTILQSEIDLGLATATDQQGVAPAPIVPPSTVLAAQAQGQAAALQPSDLLTQLAASAISSSDYLAQMAALAGSSTLRAAEGLEARAPSQALTAAQAGLPNVQGLVPGAPGTEALLPVAGSTELQAQVAAAQRAVGPDLAAEDVLAQIAQILQSQASVLAALRAGAGDASLLISGLPPGATALLLGGGWAQPLPGTNINETEALWTLIFPYAPVVDVERVNRSDRLEPASDNEKRGTTQGPTFMAYQRQGRKAPASEKPFPSTLDILD